MAHEDYYAVLGVDRRAHLDEIKRAYRRLTHEWHPDRHPGDREAEDRYRTINEAYSTLGDAQSRAKYDASLLRADALDLAKGFDGQGARDLLGNVFGDIFGSRRRERRRGRDVRYTLTVDLAQAVLGSNHAIDFEAPGPCSVCGGTGTRPGGRPPQVCGVCDGRGEVRGEGFLARRTRCGRCDGTGMIQTDGCSTCRGRGSRRQPRSFHVRVPPGTSAGAERVVKGQGEPGRFGGEPGDLRVTINVRPHAWLQRQGDDLVCQVPISISEAARGAKIPVPTIDGSVEMEVPPGTGGGARLRLRGKGVPRKGGRGDQIVTIVVETPAFAADATGEVARLLDELERASERAKVLPARQAQRSALTGQRRTTA